MKGIEELSIARLLLNDEINIIKPELIGIKCNFNLLKKKKIKLAELEQRVDGLIEILDNLIKERSQELNKELKKEKVDSVIKIIKNLKNIDIHVSYHDVSSGQRIYFIHINNAYWDITKEQYDLIKEALENE